LRGHENENGKDQKLRRTNAAETGKRTMTKKIGVWTCEHRSMNDHGNKPNEQKKRTEGEPERVKGLGKENFCCSNTSPNVVGELAADKGRRDSSLEDRGEEGKEGWE